MKLVICAGPPTCGKTTVLRQVTKRLLAKQLKVSFLKIDVQYADEDEVFAQEFEIPSRKIYSGELCPDHCSVLVLGDALRWAEKVEREFQSDLRIELANERGLLAEIARQVTESEANIEAINMQEKGSHHGVLSLSIMVKHRIHLARIIKRIRIIRGVEKVTRVRA